MTPNLSREIFARHSPSELRILFYSISFIKKRLPFQCIALIKLLHVASAKPQSQFSLRRPPRLRALRQILFLSRLSFKDTDNSNKPDLICICRLNEIAGARSGNLGRANGNPQSERRLSQKIILIQNTFIWLCWFYILWAPQISSTSFGRRTRSGFKVSNGGGCIYRRKEILPMAHPRLRDPPARETISLGRLM